jgi:uncharacterized RDD family membrane protein YckC
MEPISTYDPLDAPAAVAGKPDPVKRFLAALIDGVIAGVISGVLGALAGNIGSAIGTLLAAAYILTRDGLNHDLAPGRSVGKKLMGLAPVRLDGMPMTLDVSIKRNITLAAASIVTGIGTLFLALGMGFLGGAVYILSLVVGLLGLVEAILVLVDKDGRRLGDKYAGTQVVQTGP